MLRTLCATVLTTTLSILTTAGFAAGPVDEPYTVYVSEAGSYARCGPSGEHYRTDRLIEGEALEVYLETDDGWLGIRPPETSFCWVPADQVEVDADGVSGTIIDPEAVAWIGTNLGRARKYRWQVQFQVGESVALIGSTGPDSDTESPGAWLRIVPPPGEFRWVHDSQIVKSREAMAQLQSDRRNLLASGAVPVMQPVRDESIESPRDLDVPPAPFDMEAAQQQAAAEGGSVLANADVAQVAHSEVEPRREFRSRMSVAENVRVRDMQASESEAGQDSAGGSSWTQAYRAAPPRNLPTSQNLQASATFPSDRPGATANSLQRLQMELARLMASEASPQQTESLRSQVELLLQTSGDAGERGRARLLIDRIEQYQEIAIRRDGRSMAEPDPVATVAAPVPSVPQATTYDRQGWLVEVYSSRPDAPPFALTDRDGQTLAYLSPAASINARRMLNQQVGIVGRLSNRSEGDMPHYIATQVVRLKR
ncbi:hypothetical protein Poly24_48250 [Rosistilla carotiformis]|uniref:Bacterial SH3 domain protein n=1 Tax=Rosistilla carotiformis TaxID=2528017 RepID=A0A518JZX8_9BACT|nr:hypothetical protein [Rosistilla carotiformis]QDV71092.1 hypothetical protein Poly24_48250 [Rosistilla carotiformis]